MLGDAVISDWCASAFGERMARVMFRTGHLAQVVGTELADGRQVVIKVRPFERRVAGCVAVQAHLAKSGFPCPAPLAGPEEIRGFAVTGEALTPEGSQRSPGRGAEAFAELLARLVALAPDPASVPALTPSPPWNAWDHPGSRLWPDRDDYGRDINALPCPGWVDRAVAQVRQHLRACADPPRIGHGDWESQNIRWSGDTPWPCTTGTASSHSPKSLPSGSRPLCGQPQEAQAKQQP